MKRDNNSEIKQPLMWPEGQPRTRLNDRKGQSAWKRNYSQVVDGLEKELSRLGATSWLITHNESASADSGVAVYFSLKPQTREEWQEAYLPKTAPAEYEPGVDYMLALAAKAPPARITLADIQRRKQVEI